MMTDSFKPITVADVLNAIDQRTQGLQDLDLLESGENLISQMDDSGKVAAAAMICNGETSRDAKRVFLDPEFRAIRMDTIMNEIDARTRAGLTM